MTYRVSQPAFLSQFVCIADKCEDTCCRGWNMQLDAPTYQKYQEKAPELLNAVAKEELGYIMRRDAKTDYCVKFQEGICGIHKEKGTEFLGNACHFYPRATRTLGDQHVMMAVPSCPEVVRLALMQEDGLAMEQAEYERLPHGLANILPDGFSADDAHSVHHACLAKAADTSLSPEEAIMHINSVVHSLVRIDQATWKDAVPFYLKNAATRLSEPEAKPEDPFNLLHSACGLIIASRKTPSARLKQTFSHMEAMLDSRLDWQNITIETSENSVAQYAEASAFWGTHAQKAMEPVLRRWLQLQLMMAVFPFGGFGEALTDKVAILGVRYATIRLALMAEVWHAQGIPEECDTVRAIQSLSRILDHLADPSYSLAIYNETGWTQEKRLAGLLNI